MSKRITQVIKNGVTYNIGSVNEKELNAAITAATNPLSGAVSTLQTTKQDKLTAGIGLEITEDNTINVTIDHTLFTVVDALPTENINTNIIYLLVDSNSEDDENLFVEYIYANGAWEKVGQFKADTDLGNYYTKEEVATEINNALQEYSLTTEIADTYVAKEEGKTLLANTDKEVYDAAADAIAAVPEIYESKVDADKKIDKVLTQGEYEALATKEPNTTYFIYNEEA